MHIINAYSEACFGEEIQDKSTELFINENDRRVALKMLETERIGERFVVIHPGVTGRNRTIGPDIWVPIINKLRESRIDIVVVGTMRDIQFVGLPDLRGVISLHQVAAIIEKAKCFIGNDSGLVHVAGSTKTPIAAMYTSAKGEYRLPFRDGELGGGCKMFRTPLECYGCLEKETPPVITNGCHRGDYACVKSFNPEEILEYVLEVSK